MRSKVLQDDVDKEEATRFKSELKQALSRNKALEKQALWRQKSKEDHGSAFALSLKSRDGGVVRTVPVISGNAQVSKNTVNNYEEERRKAAEQKEYRKRNRCCIVAAASDGQNAAWKQTDFFSDAVPEDELPWKMKTQEILSNASLLHRVVAAYEASRKMSKKEKKKLKKKDKGKKKKKDKKDKKKDRKEKDRMEKRRKSRKLPKDGDSDIEPSDTDSESQPLELAAAATGKDASDKRQRLDEEDGAQGSVPEVEEISSRTPSRSPSRSPSRYQPAQEESSDLEESSAGGQDGADDESELRPISASESEASCA